MILGSDILETIKVCKKEGMELTIILADNRSTLNAIYPNNAAVIVSFEKLERKILSLKKVLDIPLIIGELMPMMGASRDLNAELKRNRPSALVIPKMQG